MLQIKDLLILMISTSLVSNVVLSQFLGLCPFLGVSKKTDTALGMGVSVIFVITAACGWNVLIVSSWKLEISATVTVSSC